MNGGAVGYGGGCTARPWAPQHRGAPALCRATYSGCCEEDLHDPQRVPAGGSPSRTMLPWGLRCLTGSPRRSSMATAGLLAQPPSRAQRRARPRQRVWMCPEDYHNLVGLKRGVTVVWGWLWGWMCNFRSPRFTYLALCVGHRAPLSSVHINWSM